MGTPTVTPNIGLQIPAFNQANWQVPTNYDWQLLDDIFGGVRQVPALSVDKLTVSSFTIDNIAALLVAACTQELATRVSGTSYTLTRAPVLIMGLYYNGQFLVPGTNYTVSGNAITLNFSAATGDTIYAVYF